MPTTHPKHHHQFACICWWPQVFDNSTIDAERDGITTCYNTLQQGVATAADMDDVDVKFRHVVEVAVSAAACCLLRHCCHRSPVHWQSTWLALLNRHSTQQCQQSF